MEVEYLEDNKSYISYDYDTLIPGRKIRIDHTIYNNENTDLSDLISKPIDEVKTMRENSIKNEQNAYELIISAVKVWESVAAETDIYDRAIQYLEVPEVEHTSNKWIQIDKNEHTISNKVYKMLYSIYERTSWRNDTKKYNVYWRIYTNRPDFLTAFQVAGQERVFKTREEAEKYIQGRIKAYSHLFTEISPPIPKEYEKSFMVHGNLLPGYITEEMQKALQEKTEQPAEKKPSIRKQLSKSKTEKKDITPKPSKSRSENEI